MMMASLRRPLKSNWICRPCRCRLLRASKLPGRAFSSSLKKNDPQPPTSPGPDFAKIKNLGIIAHIDAGKTTTTERMLYYSGYTRRIGDVDQGSTVTDFLPAERARGITIQSAAITFHWPPIPQNCDPDPKQNTQASTQQHSLNLIDTPGHADFTFEVLRSLRVLDGAVCILDGVAGVEAQTENVWHQARNYHIPSIFFVNKLDREGAAFGRTVREIGSRLRVWPAVCQIPWYLQEQGNAVFTGVIDVVRMKGLLWERGGDGRTCRVLDMNELEKENASLAEEAKRARVALIELLSGNDDELVELFLQLGEDHLRIPSEAVIRSLRKCILNPAVSVAPVFAGAAFRNIGVQPLLDAVVQLLPSPTESPDPEISIGGTKGGLKELMNGKLVLRLNSDGVHHKAKQGVALLASEAKAMIQKLEGCALAFKVVNDARRGVLIYVRVYAGVLHRNALLYNTNLHVSERAPRLLKMYANDAVEVLSISEGQIGVIVGLKHARTGDTLVSCRNVGHKTGPPAPLNTLQLKPIDVPPPVFFASIEPDSLSEEKNVADALALLLREDPSLHVTVDEDSGQTLLSGMGELHLEIARDRLIGDFKAKCTMGKIEIAYRETLVESSEPTHRIYDRPASGKSSKAGCTATVSPWDSSSPLPPKPSNGTAFVCEGNLVTTCIFSSDPAQLPMHHHHHPPAAQPLALPAHLPLKTVQTCLQNGALAALARGPVHHFPLRAVSVSLQLTPSDLFSLDTTPSSLTAAARLATSSALHDVAASSKTALMEPVMHVTISVDEASLGQVIHDISSARRGHILSLSESDSHSPAMETGDGNGGVESANSIDARLIYAPADPFESDVTIGREEEARKVDRRRIIEARVPLREMVGYLKHLRSLTGGRGTFTMEVDKFERVVGAREDVILSRT